jgi:hypothetical protein
MPLTPEERHFLEAYVYEVTHGPPFGGPATRCLAQKGIRYIDMPWVLTAYERELNAEGRPAIGVLNPEPPPSPWQSLEEVKARDGALEEELKSRDPRLRGAPTR